ncbi:hypothetical protein JQK15_25815 [Sphingobium sp. BHU LFT2]|uniref:hypothetical protein n=1 Tax=Sphingobium sp. BHU LFT2 TaxID=2807634 RepID=UPI001BE67F6B|nr:hypothetical protein [Sphingobium sp. BHU LFT2]MBT2246915.1 hypothetical protein [Sphingobium sp. BHU LFT2]
MPKLTERQRLSELETKQRKLREEIEAARLSLRARYDAIVQEFPVESLTERELRELVQLSIQLGGTTAIAALKPLLDTQSPGRKPVALR